jgi:hypothetical protein
VRKDRGSHQLVRFFGFGLVSFQQLGKAGRSFLLHGFQRSNPVLEPASDILLKLIKLRLKHINPFVEVRFLHVCEVFELIESLRLKKFEFILNANNLFLALHDTAVL